MAHLTPLEDAAGRRGTATPRPSAAEDESQLIVNLDGFEGPLDLLLSLARTQKVDLGRISILALAEQYLAYVTQARRLRIELAAGYLVMAAVARLSQVAAALARRGARTPRSRAAPRWRWRLPAGCGDWQRCAMPQRP